MSDALKTFFDAWATGDGTAIRSAIAPAFTYADPRSREGITEIDALIAYVAAFSANAPGWTATVVKSDTILDTTRATIRFGGTGPDGSAMVQLGQYVVQFNDAGQLTRLIGFVGTGDPE